LKLNVAIDLRNEKTLINYIIEHALFYQITAIRVVHDVTEQHDRLSLGLCRVLD